MQYHHKAVNTYPLLIEITSSTIDDLLAVYSQDLQEMGHNIDGLYDDDDFSISDMKRTRLSSLCMMVYGVIERGELLNVEHCLGCIYTVEYVLM